MLRFQCQVVLASSRGHTFSLRIHLGFFRSASVGGASSRGKTLANSALRVSGMSRLVPWGDAHQLCA